MSVFTEKDYGSHIDDELRKHILQNTSVHDRSQVSKETGMGNSTIRDVCYGTTPITKNNAKGIIKMMEIALVNAGVKSKHASNSRKYLKRKLKQ